MNYSWYWCIVLFPHWQNIFTPFASALYPRETDNFSIAVFRYRILGGVLCDAPCMFENVRCSGEKEITWSSMQVREWSPATIALFSMDGWNFRVVGLGKNICAFLVIRNTFLKFPGKLFIQLYYYPPVITSSIRMESEFTTRSQQDSDVYSIVYVIFFSVFLEFYWLICIKI